MRFSRRQIRAIILVGFILGFVGVPALGAVLSNDAHVSGGVTLEAADGPAVNVTGTTNASLADPFPDNNTVDVTTEQGNVTLSSSGNTSAEIAASNITGTWTTIDSLGVMSHPLTINPEDKRKVTVEGNPNFLKFRDATLDDGQVDFVYSGITGSTTLTLHGLPANQQVRAVDQSGTVVAVGETDGSGTVTLSNMDHSQHAVELKSGAASPILTDPDPDGNVSTVPSSFSVHVADDDFPGDNVTVEFFYEGSKFDTKYATSDGRVSTSNLPSIDPGVNDWSVVATDEAGNEDVVNATIGSPGTLHIRNETNPSELVDSPVEVTVKFDNGTAVQTRTTTDGTVNMSGLPTTDFIVTVNGSQDYYARTVYFQSLIGNRSVYLLNQSYPAVESRFRLDDPTGNYPSSSILIIKRALNTSGTDTYTKIYADRFGVEGVTADLQQNVRYQMAIRSPNGDVQELGPYRADVGETVTVRPGTPTIGLGNYSAGWASNAELNNRTLEARYSDPAGETQQVTIWIHEKGNTSNRLRPNTTYYDLGNFSAAYTLTENESKKTWKVNFIVDRDGEQFTTHEYVANNPDLLAGNMAPIWANIFGVAAVFLFGGMFSVLNRAAGAIMTALVGGILWWSGWLTGATTGAAVVIFLFIAILYAVMTKRGP